MNTCHHKTNAAVVIQQALAAGYLPTLRHVWVGAFTPNPMPDETRYGRGAVGRAVVILAVLALVQITAPDADLFTVLCITLSVWLLLTALCFMERGWLIAMGEDLFCECGQDGAP